MYICMYVYMGPGHLIYSFGCKYRRFDAVFCCFILLELKQVKYYMIQKFHSYQKLASLRKGSPTSVQ